MTLLQTIQSLGGRIVQLPQNKMALKLIILLLFLSLLSNFSFAKPSWKLVEVEDAEEQNQEIPDGKDFPENTENHEGDEKIPDVKNNQDGNDYRQVICLKTHFLILLSLKTSKETVKIS